MTGQRLAPGDLRVDEFLEQFDFARVTEEMSRVFDAMDRDNGILIGTPEKLIGLVTPMNFLRYLYQFAEPFVLISEIELALRALIQHSLSREQITAASRRSLASAYSDETKVPTVLEGMTFDNYRSLICHGQNWHVFESAFGGTRTLISAENLRRSAHSGTIFSILKGRSRSKSIKDWQNIVIGFSTRSSKSRRIENRSSGCDRRSVAWGR